MKKKRLREPKAKEGELLVKYGKSGGEEDLFFCWQGDSTMRADKNVLVNAFGRNALITGSTLLEELEARGYDIKTLKFSIMKTA